MEINEGKTPLKAPLKVCIWVTQKCNLSCRYCYAKPRKNIELNPSRLFELLDEMIELEVFDFVISGGEPFLHPKVFDILDYFIKRNIHIGILTNGTIYNKFIENKLINLNKRGSFLLQVSLDSEIPAINNKTRGKGSLVLKNISNLVNHSIPLQLSIVVTSYNIDTAHLLIDKFYPRIKRFQFLMLQNTNASLKYPELFVDERQANDFWEHLYAYSLKFPDDLLLPSLRTIRRNQESKNLLLLNDYKKASFDCNGCSAGITHIDIDSHFNMIGCDIAKDFTNMGNLTLNSFKDVWHSVEAESIRNQKIPACHQLIRMPYK